jgi:alpha-1,2-mannosyltransferase
VPSDSPEVDVPRAPLGALAVGALLVTAVGIACAFWMMHPPYYRKWDLVDLEVYRAAGRAVLHRHSVFGAYVHDQLRVPLPFIYPPVAAALAAPLSWVPETPANLAWTGITIALLVVVVRICFAPIIRRAGRYGWLATVLGVLAMASLSPVEDHLRFGQVGIALMACAILDCMVERPRWPRGVLIGLATAVKLVPGIFIPYLALTRRWRAALVAVVTFAALSILGFLVAPSDSWDFWTDKMFAPTSPKFFTNQSLEGILERSLDTWRPLWLVAVVAVLAFGLWRATIASLDGDELLGVAITGLTGLLVSPISWVHHMVWIIPALAVLANRATTRKQVIAVVIVTLLFVVRLPYVGNDELYGRGVFAVLLEDSYGILGLGLLLYLGDAIPLLRSALAARHTPARI